MGRWAKKYPHLQFRQHWELSNKVYFELGQCEAIVSAISEMPLRPEFHARLLQVALIKGARATTAIEGNTLSEEEIAKVVAGRHLPPSKEYQEIEVQNILGAMNELFREVAAENRPELLNKDLLLRFHERIGRNLGAHFDAIPGRFREDERVVGRYRCPDARDVPQLVDSLCGWLRTEFGFENDRQSWIDAVVEAIVGHVYVEWIHPFGDGNGRTGRLLEFYVLLRAGIPDVASHILSNFYNLTRPEYYRQLEQAGGTRDLSAFVAYAVEGLRDGLQETLSTIQEGQFRTAWRSYIYDRFAERRYRKTVFKRRRELALSLPIDTDLDIDEAILVSPTVAAAYAGLSARTVARDLDVLEEMGLITRSRGRVGANAGSLRKQMPDRRRSDREPAGP